MIRTALRLSTVAALQRGGAPVQFPTVARGSVYDSRQDDILDVAPDEQRPTIIVRTDTDARSYLSSNGTPVGGILSRSIELRIEISVLALSKDDDGNLIAGWPATDSGLEAMLDLMEYQVEMALVSKAPWALWWTTLWTKESIDSRPIFSSAEQGNVRLAAREITIRVRVSGDCAPLPVMGDVEPIPGFLHPNLIEVFDRVDAHGGGDLKISFAGTRAALEMQYLPDSGVHPLLTGVRMTVLPMGVAVYGSTDPDPVEVELQMQPLPEPPPP